MPVRRSRVLIVDDDESIVFALHRALYQDSDRCDVLLAGSAEIAQQILEGVRIDVLVTDVHLPEKSGMDLLSWVAVQAPATRVIVMTAFDVSGIRDRAHAFGCLRLVRKPFDVQEMRAEILRALTLKDTFGGDLAELSCVDVIQMLCLGRKSVALRLTEGSSTGVVHIENGEPVHAVWDDLSGEAAFFRVLAVHRGVFNTSPLPSDVERSIRNEWQYLLMEGLRRLDEAAARGEGERPRRSLVPSSRPPPPRAPAPTTPEAPVALARAREDAGATVVLSRTSMGSMLHGPGNEVDGPPKSPEVSRLIEEGFRALRAGRRDDARRSWEEAFGLEPTNRMLELNLKKLRTAVTLPPPSRETGERSETG
jgi:CheY-like chemotaxis protein